MLQYYKKLIIEIMEELHLKMVKNDNHYIKIVNGFWTLDGKKFNELTLMERKTLFEYVTAN